MRKDMTLPLAEASHYAYRVDWSAEDGEHVGTCIEFPSLSWLAPSMDEALHGIQRLVAEVLIDMRSSGEEPPAPFSEREYSGKFNLRVGGTLHRTLAKRAAEESLSLNQYVIQRVTQAN